LAALVVRARSGVFGWALGPLSCSEAGREQHVAKLGGVNEDGGADVEPAL
jgi:hypothetical protein